jgi:hypothetical protein
MRRLENAGASQTVAMCDLEREPRCGRMSHTR